MYANGFRHFLHFAIYFPHPNSNNSNIEALIGLIVLQTCLCYDKVLIRGKCFSSLFWNFYFCSYENGVLKTIVVLTEIWDAFLIFSY